MSPDEIAKEAAEEAVTYEESGVTRTLSVGAYLVDVHGYEHDRDNLRAEVAKVVLAAVERALATAPVPGGLCEERLAQIADNDRDSGDLDAKEPAWSAGFGEPPPPQYFAWAMARERRDLLRHALHLTRALQEIAASGPEAEAWARGYDAGRRAGRERMALALRQIADLGDVDADEAPAIAREALREPGG